MDHQSPGFYYHCSMVTRFGGRIKTNLFVFSQILHIIKKLKAHGRISQAKVSDADKENIRVLTNMLVIQE